VLIGERFIASAEWVGRGVHHGLHSSELGCNSAELLGHGGKRVEGGAEKQDENGFAIRQVIEMPVVRDGDLIWGEA